MKLTQPKPALVTAGQGWAEDVPDARVKAIGALEILGAAGLVLPALLDTATVLVPLAAVGLVVLMLGAAVTHARRRAVGTRPRQLPGARAAVAGAPLGRLPVSTLRT
jgi:hypothetical protein